MANPSQITATRRGAPPYIRTQAAGTRFVGRFTAVPISTSLDATPRDITNYGTVGGATIYAKPDHQTSIDRIVWNGAGRNGAIDLTQSLTLRITDGAGTTNYNKDLPIMLPTDVVAGTTMQRIYKGIADISGTFPIAPGNKLQAFVGNNDARAALIVGGTLIQAEQARKLGVPIASEKPCTLKAGSSGTTIIAGNSVLPAETNSLAGKIMRVVYSSTASIIGQQRTIVSNTVAAVSGINYAANMVVDAAFTTDPGVNDVVEIVDGDFWVAGAKATSTRQILVGPVACPWQAAGNTATNGKCLKIEGMILTGCNPATTAVTHNVRLTFIDRAEEASAGSGIARTIYRQNFTSGAGSTSQQTRGYQDVILTQLDITGPPGFGIAVQASNATMNSACGVILWGRYVEPDQANSYQPHGTPLGSKAINNSLSVHSYHMNDSGTASAGAASTLTDASKAWNPNSLADTFAGAKVSIIAGTGAGQTRTIKNSTATVLTVTPNWDTNPDATSKYIITGYGGDKFWFCYDATAGMATADSVTLMAPEKGSSAGFDYNVIIDGVIACGDASTGASALFVSNGVIDNSNSQTGLMPTMWGEQTWNNTFVCEGVPLLVWPVAGAALFGVGVGNYQSFTTACITVWGRRVPATYRNSAYPTGSSTRNENQYPMLQGGNT